MIQAAGIFSTNLLTTKLIALGIGLLVIILFVIIIIFLSGSDNTHSFQMSKFSSSVAKSPICLSYKDHVFYTRQLGIIDGKLKTEVKCIKCGRSQTNN